MKKSVMVKNGLVVLFFLLVFAPIKADTPARKEYSKEIKKDYTIDKNGFVDLSNKHGDITINTWDKNKVKVRVTISVAAKNSREADAFFETINVDLNADNDEVSVQTTRNRNKSAGKWWQWDSWKPMTNLNYSVNYEINMPKTNRLEAENKFGDIYLEELYGRANLSVEHGNMKIDKLTGKSKISVTHGEADLGEIVDADLILRHGTIDVKEGRDLKIDSRNSKLNFDKVGDINSNSKNDHYEIQQMNNLRNNGKYDQFEIEVVNSVYATAKYSDFTLGELYGTGEFDMELGDVLIEKLRKSFNKLRVDGKNVNVKVALGSGSAANVDINTNNTDLDLPRSLKTRIKNVEGLIKEIQGKIGGNPKGSIKINSEYGSIKIVR